MATTSDLRRGILIRYNNDVYRVVEYQHIAPGNWRAMVRMKLKNLNSGKVIEDRVRAGDPIEIVQSEMRPVQYLYKDGTTYHFMDTESYEQIHMSAVTLGDSVGFLKPEMTIRVEFYGVEPVGIELPQTVDLKVIETVPGIKGATATNQMKPATLETGVIVQVPPFIDEGDLIRINTETGEYLARA